MAREAQKRRSESLDEDGPDASSVENDRSTLIKRVKIELATERHLPATSGETNEESLVTQEERIEEDEDEEDEDEDESAVEKTQEYADDEENIRVFNEIRQKEGRRIGKASEAGIIKSIVLINFMCHQHLNVSFGSRMNFLVGHNGSGKSAVLTAISVALGGKAALTGRAQGLKDLIRRGSDKATITLALNNAGVDAYRPDVFDRDLIIERTIDKSGASSYKFRTVKDGRILASKREELNNILLHFNLTMDSPLTVLTQDAARSFLQSAQPSDLYRFFLDGTTLSTLAHRYEEVGTKIEQIKALLAHQEERVPDLEQELSELKQKIDASRQIAVLRQQRALLVDEIAWSYVEAKEKEVAETKEKLEFAQEKLATIDVEIQNETVKLKPLDEEVLSMESKIHAAKAQRVPVEQEQRLKKALLDKAKAEISNFDASIEEEQQSIDEIESDIKRYKDQITAKQLALEAGEDPKRRQEREKLQQMRDLERKLRLEAPVIQDQLEPVKQTEETQQEEVERLSQAVRYASQAVNQAEARLANLERQKSSRLSAFGTRMDQFVEEMKRQRWEGPVLGPLGLHVKLEDNQYRDAFHSVLGSLLCSFAVTTWNDRTKLQVMLQEWVSRRGLVPGNFRTGMTPQGGRVPPPQVIKHDNDIFDYSRGDLSHLGPTVLSKLKIDNPAVERILINSANIERSFVAPTVQSADTAMTRMLAEDRVLAACQFYTADGFSTSGRDLGRNRTSGPLQRWNGNMLFSADLERDIRLLQAEVEENKKAEQSKQAERQEAFEQHKRTKDRVSELNLKLERVLRGAKNARQNLDRLEEQVLELPTDEIGALERLSKDKQDELDAARLQLTKMLADKAELVKRFEVLKTELATLTRKVEDFVPDMVEKETALQALIDIRTTGKHRYQHWKNSREKQMAKVEEVTQDVTRLENELTDWTAKASSYCPTRVPVTASPKELEEKKKRKERTIVEAEKRQGVTAEELFPLWKEKSENLARVKASVTSLSRVVKALVNTLVKRRTWWTDALRHVAVKARIAFILGLEKRGFQGRLDFDHQHHKLIVDVNTNAQSQATLTAYKIPKNLSGGERSFATVALLLALWTSVESKIRCLDEWDVFLDPANRRIAANILLEGARESDGKQFILITPQNMNGISISGADDRTIRLSDPNRSNNQCVPWLRTRGC
ncbi:hypothetical protein BCR39DRAFT_542516 [Naematelia encephala]|uniref:RecF/RecN/SMC N-terminal domain-containing protein n=1 Tax=Naematelia encephala TaxID=71784 RepID=A0A1Y2ATK4_9TREE|nr:hypothetical protein BCR39DRAFT_542516 [Naematelia encephala]